MVNILLEEFDIDAPWLYGTLQSYIKPHHSVAVVAFSFREDVKSLPGWNALYGKKRGRYYGGIVRGLTAYGIAEKNIRFINYFTDTSVSAVQKIETADIVYFPGGAPELMMQRIRAFGLQEVLQRHKGIVLGYSAGALIQLAEYHLSPDENYPVFQYHEGLAYLHDFYLEVHYEGAPAQDAAISRVLAERKKDVYALASRAGAMVADGGDLRLVSACFVSFATTFVYNLCKSCFSLASPRFLSTQNLCFANLLRGLFIGSRYTCPLIRHAAMAA